MASNVTFIGAGNMASAIIAGMVQGGYPAAAITATATRDTTLQPLHDKLGIHTSTDNHAAIAEADVVVLSVKPQIMRKVCESLREPIQRRRPLIISVAAGLSADTLDQWLGGDLAVIRCMPNTPSLVGVGASGLFANPRVSDAQHQLATQLMESVGITAWVEEESLIDAVTAVSGSAPAYFFLIFEAMEDAGVKLGLDAETARRLTMQTALGAATMAMRSDKPPAELKRNVMSPGGTTEQAIAHLDQAGLRDILGGAMRACAQRASEMSAELSGDD